MIENFFNKNFKYAIVGASSNPDKFGNKILKALIENGFNAIPINLKETEILGLKCFKNISQIKVDVVDFVVPPTITIKILEEITSEKVWFQPGSYNDECIEFCKKNNIKYLVGKCLLEESLKISALENEKVEEGFVQSLITFVRK